MEKKIHVLGEEKVCVCIYICCCVCIMCVLKISLCTRAHTQTSFGREKTHTTALCDDRNKNNICLYLKNPKKRIAQIKLKYIDNNRVPPPASRTHPAMSGSHSLDASVKDELLSAVQHGDTEKLKEILLKQPDTTIINGVRDWVNC